MVADSGAEISPLTGDADKSYMPQPVQVKRQRVGGYANRTGDLAGRHALRSGLNEQAIDFEPVFLRERRKSGHCICLFHISTTIELK